MTTSFWVRAPQGYVDQDRIDAIHAHLTDEGRAAFVRELEAATAETLPGVIDNWDVGMRFGLAAIDNPPVRKEAEGVPWKVLEAEILARWAARDARESGAA